MVGGRVPGRQPPAYRGLTSAGLAARRTFRWDEFRVEFRVLGPLEVTADGQSLGLAGARDPGSAGDAARARQPGRLVRPADRRAVARPRPPGRGQPAGPPVRAAQGAAVGRGGRPAGHPAAGLPAPGGARGTGRAAVRAARRRRGRSAGGGRPATAAQRLDEALRLWRGPRSPAWTPRHWPGRRRPAGGGAPGRSGIAGRSAAGLRQAPGPYRASSRRSPRPIRSANGSGLSGCSPCTGRAARPTRCAPTATCARPVADLAIEPGPELRELAHPHPAPGSRAGLARHSWRAPAQTGRDRRAMPQTRYVQTGDGIHIAYQVIGRGQARHRLRARPDEPPRAALGRPRDSRLLQRLARLGRLILFDKRDTGLSDRALGDLSLEERMDDVRAVMRAARSSRAVLFGYSEAAPMSILFAATYPERVTALILGSAAPAGFPPPTTRAARDRGDVRRPARHRHAPVGQGASIEWYLPSRAARRTRASCSGASSGWRSAQRVPAHDPDDPRHRRSRRAASDPRADAR